MSTIRQRVEFPVYGLDFTADDILIAGGGGGANRSGVKNNLVSFKINDKLNQLDRVDNLLLSETEDCPMSIACHPKLPLLAAGINSSEGDIKQGINNNCRIFDVENNHIQLKTSFSTSNCKDPEEYQKVTRFSRSGHYLVTAFSDGKITVLKTSDWSFCFPPLRFKNVQDVDFDIQEEHVAVATSTALIILSILEGAVIQVIDSPKLNKRTTCEIRACRYGVNEKGIETLYAAVNPTSRGKGFICAWKLRPSRARKYPVTKVKTAGISRKSITSFAISPAGDILAYASTDLSIGLVDAQTLEPLLRIDRAHGFAITSLTFNHTGKYLASAGADNCCRVLLIPNLQHEENIWIKFLFIFLNMLLFALLMHVIVQMIEQGTLRI